MKIRIIYSLVMLLVFTACVDLDLNPLSEGSSENWYSDETEIEMSLNDLYRDVFWSVDEDQWTDDWIYRGTTNSITGGTMTSEDGTVGTWWARTYKVITRANTLIQNLDEITDEISENKLNQYKADARFNRAAQYARLISHWGDVVFSSTIIDLEESFTMGQTDKEEILQAVYDDYDFAATYLPVSYGNLENQHATKGAALAMKARIALYMGDYAVARDAAKACMDLDEYVLFSDFGKLFLSSTKNSDETILVIPRSVELDVAFTDCKNYITRNSGGWAAKDPSWELLCSFLCTDGLPIDESPLYNPKSPFENRDPRCTETIVEFQTKHLGFIYQPHPDSLNVFNFNSGKYVKNNDTRSNAQYASYNGLVWKKGVDEDWSDDYKTDPDRIIIRYADVLLMYAEAKIELNDIDDTVLDAINQVRARAYKVSADDVASYPAVTITDQAELRKMLRIERRMEFAFEGIRYMDIIRWKLAEKVLNIPNYGMLDVDDLREKVINPGLWFFPDTPEIDEDGIADFTSMYNAGLIKLLGLRTFDASKQYLWPIPSKEILINENLIQNDGY
ncbi:RagB/SusD family nutrient uptake outer membrane protein [Prolixibacteraceae bacterium Z1-6]|uniref:RagB/SusD family nutrient uptake outer membrane protein n=1 Tax=Draconibacterium aestuarii TaxID=2998507 RepID=A0A9X3J332_9BACT|nr:RagB/SusD family nutrient uptake outer membrane protein [Prolixibacteraceae bacterium Z1-6]